MDSSTNTNRNMKKVHVVVRVRPQMSDGNVWVKVINDKTIQTVNHRNTLETLEYSFERVFSQESRQQDVYETCVSDLVNNVLHGQNTSVFAYGPTGAGKTYTIMGTEANPGLIPQCMEGLFKQIQTEEDSDTEVWKTSLSYSYMEIYNEKVQDLLEPKSVDLPIRVDGNKNTVVVGVKEQQIHNMQQFVDTFNPASKNRTTAATKLNERSSRSHSILLVNVHRTQQMAPYRKLRGKLYMIDLAGCEDNRRTGNQGIRLKESNSINTSLLALGQVVNALNKGQTCIPYRDSKLTRLLQDSLGGSAHSCMVVNLSPEEEHYYDTFSTLNFARKAKKIVNNVLTHETIEKPVFQERNGTKRRVNESLEESEEDLDESRDLVTPLKHPAVKRLKTKEPIPFLSPLLRNQEKFKSDLRDEMIERLEQLEGRLMIQMQETTMSVANITQHSAVSSTVQDEPQDDNITGSGNTSSVLTKLDNLMSRLQEVKTSNAKTPQSVTVRGQQTPHSPQFNPKPKAYKDGSLLNQPSSSNLVELTSSPLFMLPAAIKRKKQFKSTAARRSPRLIRSPIYSPVREEKENTSKCFNPEKQRARNNSILNLVNSGSIKDLQSLQTVGAKRASLIFEYRTINGYFGSFKELLHIPGITKKYLDSFLRGNLVDLSV